MRLKQTFSFGLGGIFCLLMAFFATDEKVMETGVLYLLGFSLLIIAGVVFHVKPFGK